MTTPTAQIQPSAAALAKASGAALVGAAAVLLLFVLPAETGYDPTGIGTRLGLTGMSQGAEEGAPAPAVAPAATALPDKAAIARATPLRSDEMTLKLAPHSGIEVKAAMAKGDSFIFRWVATGGPVKVDMHGEPPHAKEDEFTSYWKEKQLTEAQGVLTAPFDGNHGWYWRNKGDVPVTIRITTSGFYRDLHIPQPK